MKPGWEVLEGEDVDRPGSRLTEMRYWEELGASERE